MLTALAEAQDFTPLEVTNLPRQQQAERNKAEASVKKACSQLSLNKSQKAGVLATLLPQTPVQLVFGPPGTGVGTARMFVIL